MLHEHFGDAEYWAARRSARFASHLKAIGDEFRESQLNSNDINDATIVPKNWESHQPKRGSAKGGPYICAHIRRKDYTYSRKDQIPNLESAAQQLQAKCQEHNVKTVFVATDAPESEFKQLKSFLNDIKVKAF